MLRGEDATVVGTAMPLLRSPTEQFADLVHSEPQCAELWQTDGPRKELVARESSVKAHQMVEPQLTEMVCRRHRKRR